jgi:hypothetical protein
MQGSPCELAEVLFNYLCRFLKTFIFRIFEPFWLWLHKTYVDEVKTPKNGTLLGPHFVFLRLSKIMKS